MKQISLTDNDKDASVKLNKCEQRANLLMGRVKNKRVLVTGGASGLGKAIATLLVNEGAKVTITDVSRDSGISVAKEIGAQFLYQDVTDETAWQEIISSVAKEHGGLDVLVNNAGIATNTGANDPENASLESWNRVFSVNAASVFLGCKYAIAEMRKSGNASIINMSSIAANVATPFLTAYGASKAAVKQLTMSVAVHCAQNRYGIRCNSVHPGQIMTPMLEALFDEVAETANLPGDAVQNEFLQKIPLGEFGTPEDIAFAVLYLASDESRHVTGAQFAVDGGMSTNP